MLSNSTNSNNYFRQLIILDENVELVRSDNAIFSTESLKDISVASWFPFIESIHDTLKSMKVKDDEIIFSRVESPAEFLPGDYDFSFLKIKKGEREYIRWCIYDYTNVYSFLTKYQQLKNEKDIHRQKLEYRDQQVNDLDDLF